MQPSYPSEKLDMYQRASNNTPPSFPHQSHMTGPAASNHSTETLIADMWKSCPALCASIRHDFDISAIFHPALIDLHGETFLRLAASQIAMYNQATEMTHMRNALLQKQKLLNVNTASAKGLQTKFVSQQSELKDVRRLLEQKSQSLTSSDATDNGQVPKSQNQPENQSQNREVDVASQGVTVSPTTTASTLAEVDGPVQKFYNRSAALSPLGLSLHSDNLDKYDEQHGYGHAETQGPSFWFDRANDAKPGNQTRLLSKQTNPLPPTVSTSPDFKPDVSSVANPIVSLAAKQQTSIVRSNGGNGGDGDNEDDQEKTRRMAGKYRTYAGHGTRSAGDHTMTRERGNSSGHLDANKTPETPKKETDNEIPATIPANPSKTAADDSVHEEAAAIIPSKPASYAAAVRTGPTTTPKIEQSPMKSSSATPENAPTPDLGFTLEPLPKPTIQQVLSQQQQPQALKTEDNCEAAPYDFNEWKQRKIEAGTWEDRTNQPHMPRAQHRPNFPNSHYPNARFSNPNYPRIQYANPHHPNLHYSNHRPFQPSYRGRGGRLNHHHNGNFGPGPMNDEERKRSWLAWKQQCIKEGRWHPTHPFREEWKNE
jgi:hypothetical protein